MTQQIINVGAADKGDGDPLRTAFIKVNANFTEVYNVLTNQSRGTIQTTDIIGSVFADDSTLLVDGVNGRIPYSVLSGAPTVPTNTNQLVNGAGFITSNGIPSQTGHADKYLKTDGAGNLSWAVAGAADGNTTYAISAETSTGGVNLTLTGSDSSTDNVKFAEGSNITLTRTDANTITIASTASGGATVVSAPVHQYGVAGNLQGMLAYDTDYFYWCYQDYVNDSTACWRRVARSLTSW